MHIPVHESEDEGDSVTVEGKRGDYVQSREVSLLPLPDVVNIYTDKPLYEPGQTMHVRLLSLSGAGPVRVELEHEVRVLDEQRDVLFNATVTTSHFGIASADWLITGKCKIGPLHD